MIYEKLVQLGFQRFDLKDSVHFRLYGWDAFFLSRKIGTRHELVFEPTTPEEVQLNKYDKERVIIAKWVIRDFDTVKKLVELFG
jgi:hypothetical protein